MSSKIILIFFISIALFANFGCSKKVKELQMEPSRIKLLKDIKDYKLSKAPRDIVQKQEVPVAMPKIEGYKTKQEKLSASFKVNSLFSVREFSGNNGDFYAVSCVERTGLKSYPADFSLVYYPPKDSEPYKIDVHYDKMQETLKILRNFKIVELGEEAVLGEKGKYFIITYSTTFPAHHTPVFDVRVKEKITVFKKNNKIYELRCSGAESNYYDKQEYFKLFVETLEIG